MLKPNLQKGVFTLLIGIIIWFLPVPKGLTPQAMHTAAIFVATIIGCVLQPLPIGAVAFIGVGLAGFLKVVTPAAALTGFGNAIIWLIASAFMFSMGFIKTGLGRRIAYKIMTIIGGSSLKLGYTMAITDLIMSPATPSNTARAGGIIFPIVRGICSAFKSEPDNGPKRIGTYLILSTYMSDCITSSMFITAVASNSICVAMAAQTIGVHLTWGTWALACIVPGLIALLICPYLVYKLNPPELKTTTEAKEIAQKELQKMGPVSRNEKILFAVFILALLLWATSSFTNLNATMIALVCIGIMLVSHTVEWNDVLSEKGAWDSLIWMGGLMSLATALNKSGFVTWFAKLAAANISGFSGIQALVFLVLVYMYSHYGFASLTAHVSAMYGVFVTVAVAVGAPAGLTAMAFGCLTGLIGVLTHYAAGAAPIFFGAGYITQEEWWKTGFIVSVVNLICFLGIGSLWWKFIGLW